MRRAAAAALAAVLVLAGCSAEPEHDDLTGQHPTGAEAPRPGPTRAIIPSLARETAAGPGVFSTICNPTHLSQDDPIVFPNESGRAHLHVFAGSVRPIVDESSTPASIRGHGTTCRLPTDEAAYWVPALLRGDAIIPPGNMIAYYRTGGIGDPTTIEPFPVDLRMIAGQSTATAPQSIDVVSWDCGGPPTATIPTGCAPGEDMRLKVNFPNCWNGTDSDSVNHQDHTRYSWEDDGSRRACPATHPVPIPELKVNFRWEINDDPTGLALSSGGQYSGHADFMNGWAPGAIEALVTECLVGRIQCVR